MSKSISFRSESGLSYLRTASLGFVFVSIRFFSFFFWIVYLDNEGYNQVGYCQAGFGASMTPVSSQLILLTATRTIFRAH